MRFRSGWPVLRFHASSEFGLARALLGKEILLQRANTWRASRKSRRNISERRSARPTAIKGVTQSRSAAESVVVCAGGDSGAIYGGGESLLSTSARGAAVEIGSSRAHGFFDSDCDGKPDLFL